MSDYIDKWELIEKMEWDNDIEKWTIWEDDLKSIPSANVEPVVRCKDCASHGNCLTEDTFRIARIENPYCCGGKRKEANT